MSVSGHRSEASIRSYVKTSTEMKQRMSETLSSTSSVKKPEMVQKMSETSLSVSSAKRTKMSFNFGVELYKTLREDDEDTPNTKVNAEPERKKEYIFLQW